MQNCLQLSGFFVDANAFAVTEYVLTAAQLVVEQHEQRCNEQQQQQQQQQQQGAEEPQGLHVLDADVRANLLLAWAKLYLYRLVASHKVHVEGGHIKTPYASPSALPEMFRCVDLLVCLLLPPLCSSHTQVQPQST